MQDGFPALACPIPFSLQNKMMGVSRRCADVLRQNAAIGCVCNSLQFAGYKRNPPHRPAFLAIPPINRLYTLAFSVEEELCGCGICHDRHIDHLARIPVPVHADMYHGILRPERPVQIPEVLGEDGGIHCAKVAAAGMIGRRFADIVDARPDILTQRIGAVQVVNDHFRKILRSPGGFAVAQG